MSKDLIENFQKLTQLTLENFKKLGEANLRVGEKLLQEQVELTNAILAAATEKAGDVSEAKDLKDVAAWQAELAQEYTKKVVESSRNCADIVAEAGKVYSGLFESALKTANSVGEKAKANTNANANRNKAA
jgi:phasin family protein